MNNKINHQTAIVLLDKKSAENDFIKQWLEQSSLLTNEITNIFQALEDISDFTVRSRPDVILVEVDSLKNEFSLIQEMMRFFTDKECFPIMALSDGNKIVNDKECFEGNFAQVKAQIEKLLPQTARAARA
jgi:hypothetical protein